MNARIQKWGNSLALRIPKSTAEEAGFIRGQEVDLQIVKGRLIIRPWTGRIYSLSVLLRRVRRSNIHPLVDFGGPVGRELL